MTVGRARAKKEKSFFIGKNVFGDEVVREETNHGGGFLIYDKWLNSILQCSNKYFRQY